MLIAIETNLSYKQRAYKLSLNGHNIQKDITLFTIKLIIFENRLCSLITHDMTSPQNLLQAMRSN